MSSHVTSPCFARCSGVRLGELSSEKLPKTAQVKHHQASTINFFIHKHPAWQLQIPPPHIKWNKDQRLQEIPCYPCNWPGRCKSWLNIWLTWEMQPDAGWQMAGQMNGSGFSEWLFFGVFLHWKSLDKHKNSDDFWPCYETPGVHSGKLI